MKLLILGGITAIIFTISIIAITVFDLPIETRPPSNEERNEIEMRETSAVNEPEPSSELKSEESQDKVTLGVIQRPEHFTIRLEEDPDDNRFLIVSGKIPSGPRHLTGVIYSGAGLDVRLVHVFQIQLEVEENTFSYRVGINDYLWEENTTYTVSVKHGNLTHKTEFYKGTSELNFEDNIVPLRAN